MPIVWKDEMAVGNLTIDDEHKLLICLINSVEIALKADNHGNMLRFIFHELYQYTVNHFHQEEKIMLDYHYHDYMAHKMEHQKILQQMKELGERLDKISNSDDQFSNFEEDIVGLLRSWILDHVIKIDLKMKPMFKG